MSKTCRLALMLTVILALLSGCAIETDRSDKPAPDWSRGLLLGRANARQPAALAVGPDGAVHIAWCNETLQYARLDAEAQVQVNRTIESDLPKPRRPQLAVDAQGRTHLVWLSRDGDRQKLAHVEIAPDGTPGSATLLSDPAHDVTGFQLYVSASGAASVVWASDLDGAHVGLLHATIGAQTAPALLAPGGISPAVLVDAQGTVHLAWLQERGYTSRSVYYATASDLDSPQPRLEPEGGQKLVDYEFAASSVSYGPTIGMDTRTVYVLWSVQNLGGGLTPTAAFAYYVAFEPGKARTTRPQNLSLPDESAPRYDSYSSPYGFDKLKRLTPADLVYVSDFCNSPSTVSTQQSELPVAVSLLTRSVSDSQIQLATVILSDGQEVGYQLAGKTDNASLLPTLVADSNQHLHMVWIDTAGFEQYDVYYASLAPDARRWLDRTSQEDLVIGAADLLWGVMSGIGLLPIAGIWTFPALAWVMLFFVFSGQEDMDRLLPRIGFGIAVVLYAGVKVLLLPGLFRGTPFLHRVPENLTVPLGIAVPVVILGIALGAVYLYTRKALRATIFRSYFIMALVDVVLTITLYAPRFFDPG